ncbi:MAG: PTS sugar transporter subunit IIC [Lachnospiraceae bacterium]|nr:PTS sugar transporter subunit IIC [Lachnospiraceae bacterium]
MKKKGILNSIFIDGLSGMALGLFGTLIIGTIVEQLGNYIPGVIGHWLVIFGTAAKYMTGAGIGVGVASKFKQGPLVTVSSATAGMVGAYASKILAGTYIIGAGELVWADDLASAGKAVLLSGFGEPLGAFVAAYVAVVLGNLVAGKTKIDIIVTPLVSILSGSAVGIILGPPISKFMGWLGELVNINVTEHPVIGGIVVSVLMGMFLTLPISSAAIGISMGLSGLAAGAATIGCCCNMVGFAVASYRENKFGGFLAQGLGTSMLQMPNIIRHPMIWLPEIVASAILGPIGTTLLVINGNAVGSGMGTAGLVGPLMAYQVMAPVDGPAWAVVKIFIMLIILPAVLSFAISEGFRKAGWIHFGDQNLTVE